MSGIKKRDPALTAGSVSMTGTSPNGYGIISDGFHNTTVWPDTLIASSNTQNISEHKAELVKIKLVNMLSTVKQCQLMEENIEWYDYIVNPCKKVRLMREYLVKL